MRLLVSIWMAHFLATVGGWYALGSVAQGVVDGSGLVPPPLVVLNEIIELLSFPLVTTVLWLFPGTGGYSLVSFASFAGTALVNSAVVASVAAYAIRRIRRSMATR